MGITGQNECDASERERLCARVHELFSAAATAPTETEAASCLDEALPIFSRLGEWEVVHAHRSLTVREVLTDLALARRESGQFALMLHATTQLVEAVPDSAHAHFLHAYALKKAGGHGDALQSIEMAVALDHGHREYHLERARILTEFYNDTTEAMRSLLNAVARGADVRQLKSEAVFAPLRGEPDFDELLQLP